MSLRSVDARMRAVLPLHSIPQLGKPAESGRIQHSLTRPTGNRTIPAYATRAPRSPLAENISGDRLNDADPAAEILELQKLQNRQHGTALTEQAPQALLSLLR